MGRRSSSAAEKDDSDIHWQVPSELGHTSTAIIETRCGHLASVTDRTEVVEVLPDLDKQPERVPAQLFVTAYVTRNTAKAPEGH